MKPCKEVRNNGFFKYFSYFYEGCGNIKMLAIGLLFITYGNLKLCYRSGVNADKDQVMRKDMAGETVCLP